LQYLEFQFSTIVLKLSTSSDWRSLFHCKKCTLLRRYVNMDGRREQSDLAREEERILACIWAFTAGKSKLLEGEHTQASAAAAKSKHRDNDDVLQRRFGGKVPGRRTSSSTSNLRTQKSQVSTPDGAWDRGRKGCSIG
jgi:hypothetical protein